jgi:hypothetical protein
MVGCIKRTMGSKSPHVQPKEALRLQTGDRGGCDPIPYEGRYQAEEKRSSKIHDDTLVFEMDKDLGTVKSSRAVYRSIAVLPNLS